MTKANPQLIQSETNALTETELLKCLNSALAHHQAHEFKVAEKLYKKALLHSRYQSDVANLAAIFYQQIGRHKYCITLLNKALDKSPKHPKSHQIIGRSYLVEGQYEKALSHLELALQLDHKNSEIQFRLGECYHRMGKLNQAMKFYQQAIENKDQLVKAEQTDLYNYIADLFFSMQMPEAATRILGEALENDVIDYNTLVRLVIARGESHSESVKLCLDAIISDPTRDEAKALFARACELGSVPVHESTQMKAIITLCLESKNVNHQPFALPWMVNHFVTNSERQGENLLNLESFEDFQNIINDSQVRSLIFDPFFRIGLKQIRSNRVNIERLYTFIRRHLLNQFQQQIPLDDQQCDLLSAMAHQCYLTEYVFYQTDEEKTFITDLKTELEVYQSLGKDHVPALLLFACYKPLVKLKNHHCLLNIAGSQPFKDVVSIQIKDAHLEQQLKKTIKSLNRIVDGTSQKVRQQYEENPYPRWTTESVFKPFHSQMVEEQYQNKIDVLIAGCGTGKQIVSTFHYYPNARFKAIDISHSSLAYAKRKLREYGLEQQVELLHGDLLDCQHLNETFDFIECCGVLHHMAEPQRGLNALTSILKPTGKMKLALYSTMARHKIIEARNNIDAQSISPTAENIRAFRKQLIDNHKQCTCDFPIEQWRDFNTLSECRDLLFHSQETTYNCLQIKELLSNAGLTLELMMVDNKLRSAFSEMFPDKDKLTSLECWHDFEQKYPNSFAGMYQFMAKKSV